MSITIKGEHNEAVVYADSLDSASEGVIKAFCNSEASAESKIRIMPDVHAGVGCCVGTTMTITDRVAPFMVSGDIGCSVSAVKAKCKRLELQKLDTIIRENIPSGFNIRSEAHQYADDIDLDELLCDVNKNKAFLSIGTLGGGNHFIELDKDENGEHWLIIHTGSRNLGVQVAKFYQDKAYESCSGNVPYELAYLQGEQMQNYLHDMKIVQQFAQLNHAAIIKEICDGMKFKIEEQFTTVHNYIDLETMILRKGSVSAQKAEKLIIPMNMRDGCLICIGKGNPEWNCSAPHGAGRLYSRKEAKESFTVNAFKKEMKGIYTTSINAETLDECPMAYKPVEEITKHIGDTVEIVGRTTPIYNFKAGGNE